MSILEVLVITVPALLTVAFVTVAERKTMASMQRRLGPNIVGYYGLLQAFADALKLLLKEYVSPTQANLALFFLGPVITLIFSLLGYGVVPYGPGLALWDFNLGILYMLAVSSLATYGILLAGWSANSKYAFLGSLRSTAQLISYELILSSAILLVVLLTGSLNLTVNIEVQRVIWFILPLFPVFVIFFIGSVAETNRAPFDLAEAKIVTSSNRKFNPYWLTGFTDAEGSFIVKVFKATNYKLGWRIQLTFQIKLNSRDHYLLEEIKNHFGVGTVRKNKDNTSVYSVINPEDLSSTIFPHFDLYPLLTNKWADYQLFKEITKIVLEKNHYTEIGFLKILGLKFALNLGLSQELKYHFPNVVEVIRPVTPKRKINENWLIGLAFYFNKIAKFY